jgi:hypothetical protein
MRPLKAISGPCRAGALSWAPEAPDDLYKFSRPLKVFFKALTRTKLTFFVCKIVLKSHI